MSLMKQSQAAPPEPPEPNTVPITVGLQATFLPTYGQYPLWLDSSGLSPTARVVYRAIYSRAVALSLQNRAQYANAQGHIFVIYTNEDLGRDCDLKPSALKTAKKQLKAKGYLIVEHIAHSSAVRIYPCFPSNTPMYQFPTSLAKNNPKTNSTSVTDEYYDANLKKSLTPEAYEAYRNIGHS